MILHLHESEPIKSIRCSCKEYEEKPVGQEDFVRQLTKETAPEASEQKFSEEDDEQRYSVYVISWPDYPSIFHWMS